MSMTQPNAEAPRHSPVSERRETAAEQATDYGLRVTGFIGRLRSGEALTGHNFVAYLFQTKEASGPLVMVQNCEDLLDVDAKFRAVADVLHMTQFTLEEAVTLLQRLDKKNSQKTNDPNLDRPIGYYRERFRSVASAK